MVNAAQIYSLVYLMSHPVHQSNFSCQFFAHRKLFYAVLTLVCYSPPDAQAIIGSKPFCAWSDNGATVLYTCVGGFTLRRFLS